MGFFKGKGAPPLAQQNTILSALRLSTSSYGKVLKVVYGQNRVPGDLLDYQDFTPIPHTSKQTQGGKGGSAASTTPTVTYTYTAAVVIALCEGVINSLRNVYDTKGKLTLVSQAVAFTVPGGGGSTTVTPGGGGVYYGDDGVGADASYSVGINDYGSDGPRTLSGTQRVPMRRVVGTPTAGQYAVNTTTGAYTFAAADAGKATTINFVYSVPDTSGSGQPLTTLSFTLFPGTVPQTPWGYMTTNHPANALPYAGIAYIAASAMDLGSSGQLPNYTYEVVGLLPFGSGINDCNPKDVVVDAITSASHGTLLNSAFIGNLTSFSNYCVAYGIFLSPVLDMQISCRDFIKQILMITNSAPFCSEGVLKIVPYGDQSMVGNGATYTPNTTPQYDLTVAAGDFMPMGKDPVEITVAGPTSVTNAVQLEVLDRGNAYAPVIIEDKNDADININGLRPANVVTAHEICLPSIGATVAMAINRRNVNIRNSYKFKLGIKYILLEPMDMVTLTDGVNLDHVPVRITQIERDEKDNLTVQAEEFPWGTATATAYPKQAASGFAAQADADPGTINTPIIFEATNRLSQFGGYEIWMAVSGAVPGNWGGCRVWISPDNASYQQIGTIYGPARMGLTTSLFNNVADPDTTSTLGIDLTESLGIVSPGSLDDCDNFRTLCYVGGELISYQGATLTAANKYNLGTRLRRGVFGTSVASHAIGSLFARLDNAIFTYQYDPQWVGKTIFIKFTSFNKYNKREQDRASVSPVSFTIVGANKGSVDNATGLVVPNSIDFTQPYVNKNMDNIPDGATNGGIGISRRNASTDASGNLLLKNLITAVGVTVNPTTSSSSFSVIPEMSQTITTHGNKVLVLFDGMFQISTGVGIICVFRDGVAISISVSGTAAPTDPYSSQLQVMDLVGAGVHTYDIRWFTNGGGTITALSTNRTLQVVELG